MDKIYGKSLLEQIKVEKLEEKNRLIKEEIERKKQLEMEKERKKQQARMLANLSNKNKNEKQSGLKQPIIQSEHVRPLDITVDMQRPAFVTVPFRPYRNKNYLLIYYFGEF
jgi:hypothetical protein